MDQILIKDCILLFAITYFLVYFLKKALIKFNFFDYVNNRSSHSETKVRGGGLSFLIVGSIYFYSKGFNFPLLCNLYGILGFFDDRFEFSTKKRLLFQFIFSIIIVYNSPFFNFLSIDLNSGLLSYISLVLLTTLVTGIINFINFMDGVDGIIGSCLIPWLISLSIISSSNIYIAFSLSIFGFLLWNWQPSKIFMGDVGSMFIGSFIAISTLQFESYSNFTTLLMIISPLIFDPFTCLITRYSFGHNIFSAHRLHLYQRLVQNGLEHWQISLIYCLTVCLLSFSYFIGGFKILTILSSSLFIIFVYFSILHKSFFKKIT